MGGVALLAFVLVAVATVAADRAPHGVPRWLTTDAADQQPTTGGRGGSTAQLPEAGTVTLAATGDVILGSAPDRLPARDGAGFFADVRAALAADLTMGNLEQPLTEDTGVGKCRPPATASGGSDITVLSRVTPPPVECFQFRAPPGYAAHLRAGGFHLLNQANNHANDFGGAGIRNTRRALDRQGLRYTGAADEVTVVQAGRVRVGVVGFSVYAWSNNLLRLDEAAAVVRRAVAAADVVVVQAHMGAEGADKTAVRPGEERFAGENRGDPVAFSRAVIDAGADLVVGHGPHVLRGMEFYRGRLIAYSLGNFAAGGAVLRESGRSGLGGVLRVALRRDGTWSAGEFVSTAMADGRPTVDRAARSADLVRTLSTRDFPRTGARFDVAGRIVPPLRR
ncbi:CapA family protein [Pilimelia anulata]|uniref:CapA family protein n=1 Tax=Pilimelia anulata TaxID=53371 RepID=UPI00166950FF|nr:CapA family protein [Pilimelia anulata]